MTKAKPASVYFFAEEPARSPSASLRYGVRDSTTGKGPAPAGRKTLAASLVPSRALMVISVHLGNAAICSGVNCNRGLACTGLGGAAPAGADCACACARFDIASEAAAAAIVMNNERIDDFILFLRSDNLKMCIRKRPVCGPAPGAVKRVPCTA